MPPLILTAYGRAALVFSVSDKASVCWAIKEAQITAASPHFRLSSVETYYCLKHSPLQKPRSWRAGEKFVWRSIAISTP